MLAPGSWDAYERNNYSKPRFLHLPIQKTVLNYLTWDIWFYWINNNLLIFRLPAPSGKFLCKFSPPHSPHLLRRVLSGLLEVLSSGPELLKIKHNSQHLGCDYFLSQQKQTLQYKRGKRLEKNTLPKDNIKVVNKHRIRCSALSVRRETKLQFPWDVTILLLLGH